MSADNELVVLYGMSGNHMGEISELEKYIAQNPFDNVRFIPVPATAKPNAWIGSTSTIYWSIRSILPIQSGIGLRMKKQKNLLVKSILIWFIIWDLSAIGNRAFCGNSTFLTYGDQWEARQMRPILFSLHSLLLAGWSMHLECRQYHPTAYKRQSKASGEENRFATYCHDGEPK